MKHYFTLLLGVLITLGGLLTIAHYFSGANQQADAAQRAVYEQLATDGVAVVAELDPGYDQTTLRVASSTIKMYRTTYRFAVDGVAYSGVYRPQEPPTTRTVPVTYLPQDPAVNSADVQRDIRFLQREEESRFPLYVGLFLVMAGLGRALTSRQSIREAQRLAEEEEQRQIEAYNQSQGVQY